MNTQSARVRPVGSAAAAPSLDRAERALRLLTSAAAGLLVVSEVIVLLVGVAARFLFNQPIVWSDELASILFSWLAMLGAAVAVQRGEHMLLGYVVGLSPPRVQTVLRAVAWVAPAVLMLLLLSPALDYCQDQSFMQTPALDVSGAFRAAAFPVGAILILASSLLGLARNGLGSALTGLVVIGLVAALLYAGLPVLNSMGNWNLVVFFVVLLGAAVFAGVPIAFAFGAATVAYLLVTDAAPLTIVVGRLDEGMGSLILLAVPLFVLLGQLMVLTGLADLIVECLALLLGHVRGGLSYVLLGAMILVSGISGSKAADMAAVAPTLFPEMRRRGAHDGELISLLTAAGAMSETIPPSIVLITIGSATGVSIAALFAAGLLPGLLLAVLLALVARRRAGGEHEIPRARAPIGSVARAAFLALPALALPVLVRLAVTEGVATATEVSTIGIAYTVLIGLLVYRRFDWRRMPAILEQTASLSGAILLIIGMATGMAWALTQSGFSHALAQWMQGVPGGAAGFMAISVVTFVVLGSVLEGIPAVVLFGPLLFPIARTLGINEIHYAIVVVLSMGLGLFAPPFGVGYYTACLIGGVAPDVAMRRVWPYLGALAIGLVLIAAVPSISTVFIN